MVRVYEPYDSEPLLSRQGHAAQVVGLVFGATHDDVFSVAIDGSAAAWKLDADSPLAHSVGVPHLAPTVMRPVAEQDLMAGEAFEGTAGVWRIDGSGTQLVADLIEESRAVAGQEILVSGAPQVEDGFEAVESEVVAIDIDPSGRVCAWSTLGGGVFTRRLTDPSARLAGAKANRSLTIDEWQEILPGEPWEATCSEGALLRLATSTR